MIGWRRCRRRCRSLDSELNQPLVTFSASNQSVAEQLPEEVSMEQSTEQPSDDDYARKLWEKHVNDLKAIPLKKKNDLKAIISTSIAKLGVPMPPGMALKKSARLYIPIFDDLVVEQRKLINTEHDNINRKASIAYFMMLVILLVIFVVSSCNPSYASLGIGVWFSIICCICSIIYLCWLREKELALEKYRVKIAEFVLEQRKKLPMVEFDNVEADQPATDLINCYCYSATIPLPSILNYTISFAALGGLVSIGFCGFFYWSPHTIQVFAAAVSVISCVCGCYYFWRKLQVEVPTTPYSWIYCILLI